MNYTLKKIQALFKPELFHGWGKKSKYFEGWYYKIIDASDKYVIPGGVDVHTHLDMPLQNTFSSDDFESGTIAAAFGGTTTIIDFPTQLKGDYPQKALEQWFKKAEGAIVM